MAHGLTNRPLGLWPPSALPLGARARAGLRPARAVRPWRRTAVGRAGGRGGVSQQPVSRVAIPFSSRPPAESWACGDSLDRPLTCQVTGALKMSASEALQCDR
eukprot:scaffold87_cov388-Prasinococcus_capsulatus_cf.AAC.3